MFSYLSLLHHQAAQLAYILDGRLKDLAEDVGREKALKDMVVVTVKDKEKAAAIAEKKVAAFEKARVAVEKRSSELEVKLGVAEQKLAEAMSLNTARDGELVDLKAALEVYKKKNGIIRDLLMLRTLPSLSFWKPGSLVLRRVSWLPYGP